MRQITLKQAQEILRKHRIEKLPLVGSDANVSGVPLSDMCEMRGHYNHKENTKEIADAVKNSAYEIINKKHATYYGIAMSVKRICEVIMRDEKSMTVGIIIWLLPV